MENLSAGSTIPYRLTNVTHSEIAQCLPLPSLPPAFGASSHELVLYDEDDSISQSRVADDRAVLAQAGKIAELLRATDVSYLYLRDKGKVAEAGTPGERGGLLDAVLRCDPGAFSTSSPARENRKHKRYSISNNSRQPIVPEGRAGLSRHIHEKSRLPFEPNGSHPTEAATSVKKTRMQRKETVRSKHDNTFDVNATLLSSFCEILDELFERTDIPPEDEGEDAGLFLSLADTKVVAEGVADLRSKNALHLLPLRYLEKLLSLLDRLVQNAHNKDIEDDEDTYSDNFSVVMSALEAVQSGLLIMTEASMPKQVYKEEIIDRIIEFTRYHVVHTVFTAYDPVYRQVHKRSAVDVNEIDENDEEDLFENGGHSAKKSRVKDRGGKGRRGGSLRVSGLVSTILHKLCSILGLLKDLLAVQSLLDNTVLQLTHTVLSTLAVDNIQLLQLKAIGVACMVYDLYPRHRLTVLDEIISLLWKLPSSRRSLRTFPLQDDEQSSHIQIFTAVLLQIVQCSVTLPNLASLTADAGRESTTPEKSSKVIKCFEPATECSNYFWTKVFARWAAPKAQDSADVKVLVENVVVDLLTTLNSPEFPAASLLLQLLCLMLFGPAGVKAKDAGVRGAAIDLLGLIGAKLKQDDVACANEKLWILQETAGSRNVLEDKSLKQACAVCGKSKSRQVILSCDSCHRWFHGDCIGVTGHDMLGHRWLCHFCLCRGQLASLRADVKPHVVGGPSLPRNKKVEEVDNSKEGGVVIQQILLNYLQEVARSDGLAAYAHRFYLCQWYREEAEGIENLQFYHHRAVAKAPVQGLGIAHPPLARSAIVRISQSLGQQRPLARGFDRILQRLLASLQENSPTPRAKALRAVSAIVEVSPDILGDERVQRAVEGRFLDSAISVREAAVEIVGRHIVSRPDFAVKYFEKIAERIMDTGVSVRKRVIKIIRDVCVSNAGFAKATDGCLRIISRINDEETSIQDLVGKTFYELWFEELSGQSAQYATAGSVVPQAIEERTKQLVDVLRSLPNNQPVVTIIKRSLNLEFCPQAVKNSSSNTVMQAAVRHGCELMCKCLLESILKAEDSATEDEEVHALPHIMALHAFCTVDPAFCAPASDPSRYAVTLQPYLKTQLDNRNAAQLLQSIVFVIDTVLPSLKRPPESLITELERDLRQLIVHYSFLTVVYSCIKCLCSLSKAVKRAASFEFLLRRFFKLLDERRAVHVNAAEKSNILRFLFCLGVLVRYGSTLIESMNDAVVNLPRILGLYKHYFSSGDFDIKAKALQAIGNVSIAKPEVLMEKDMGRILDSTLSRNATPQIQMQTLRNFSDYLLDVEEKMKTSESASEDAQNGHLSKAVPVAAGAGDSNICGGIIQLHWDQILGRCLDINVQVRFTALKVVEVVLRQGLVHPITCVPQLIAMEIDPNETNSKLAHRLLVQLIEKYPSFFESRLGDGLQLSFAFLQSGAASMLNVPDAARQSPAKVARKGISRVYKLIRASRLSRNKFLASVIRKFDSAASGNPISLDFLIFCAEIMSSLPFALPDEPLYLLYSLNRVLQVRGGVLQANMKASISNGLLGEVARHLQHLMADEKEQMGTQAYDMNATEEPISNGPLEPMDDTAGIPEEALKRLGTDCHSAMALAVLLRLKRHLKILYNLNDLRCQNFSPTEAIKPGDVLSRREAMREFNTAELPTTSATTVRRMLEQYEAFKRLLKEDAVDYSTYTAHVPGKKRGRVAANNVEAGEAGPVKPSPSSARTLRKRNPAAVYVDEEDSE